VWLGPGLLAYLVTSKFADYLPLYRLEYVFQRQGFEISRACNRPGAEMWPICSSPSTN
jgi:transposase